jgi:hypothetical protein
MAKKELTFNGLKKYRLNAFPAKIDFKKPLVRS